MRRLALASLTSAASVALKMRRPLKERPNVEVDGPVSPTHASLEQYSIKICRDIAPYYQFTAERAG